MVKLAAEAYLSGQPEQWTSIVAVVGESMTNLAERHSARPFLRNALNDPAYIFEDAVSICLFEPSLVRQIAATKGPRDLMKVLRRALYDAVEEESGESGTGERVFFRRDPLIDILPRDYDPEEPVPWVPESDFVAALEDALEVASAATTRPSEVLPSPLAVIQLDIIDVALYQALVQHPELTRNLPWRAFERLLADMLEEFGFEVELTQGTKDGGIDVIAVKNELHFGAHRYLLQAKRWNNKVGIEPVQQLLFLQSHHRATKSCLVTTSTFTSGAWKLAEQYRWQLELRDQAGLAKWIQMVVESKKKGGSSNSR